MTSDADFVTAPKNAHVFLFGGKESSPGQFFCVLGQFSDDPQMDYMEWWYEIIPLFQESLLGVSSDGVTTYTIRTSVEWNAFVAVLLAYVKLHDGNKVVLHQMGSDRKSFEVYTGQSESEIRDLLVAKFEAPNFDLGVPVELDDAALERPGRTAHLYFYKFQRASGDDQASAQFLLLRFDEEDGWRYEFIPLLRESLLGTRPYREALGEPQGPMVADYWWVYAVFGTGGWAALATVIRTYLTRNKNNKVVIYTGKNEKFLEVSGRYYSVEEIRELLKAKIEAEFLMRELAHKEETELRAVAEEPPQLDRPPDGERADNNDGGV